MKSCGAIVNQCSFNQVAQPTEDRDGKHEKHVLNAARLILNGGTGTINANVFTAGDNAELSERILESFQFMQARIVKRYRQSRRSRLTYIVGNANAICGRELLQSLCEHYLRPGERTVGNHDFSHADADAYAWSNVVVDS